MDLITLGIIGGLAYLVLSPKGPSQVEIADQIVKMSAARTALLFSNPAGAATLQAQIMQLMKANPEAAQIAMARMEKK